MAANGIAGGVGVRKRGYPGFRRFARLTELGRSLFSMQGTRRPTLMSTRGTLPIQLTSVTEFGSAGEERSAKSKEMTFSSGGTATDGRRSAAIRKKIIGHRMAFLRTKLGGHRQLRFARRAFALAHEQARHHGAGIFFEPLVEQGANFLAEIGCVSKSRELVALQ